MRKTLFALVLLLLSVYLGHIPTVSAEEASGESTLTPTRMYQDKMKKEDANLKMKILNEARDATKLKKAELLEDNEALREEIKAKREAAIERFKVQREEFKEQMATIKDGRKKELVEGIDEKINEMNTNHTERLGMQLTKMNEILGNIKEKAAELEEEGESTTEVDASIANAEAIMATAQAAVSDQAGKEYVIEISSESKLRTDVQPTFQQFKTDIRSVHMKVKAVHASIIKAARDLAKVGKKNEPETLLREKLRTGTASSDEAATESTDTTVTRGEEEEVNADL